MNVLDLLTRGINVEVFNERKPSTDEVIFRFRKGDKYFQRAVPMLEIVKFNGGAVSSSLLEDMICREAYEYFKEEKDIKYGDWVICTESGVVGQIINFYTPTSCEEQIMVKTRDGRRYHAPTRLWKHYQFGTTASQVIIDEAATYDGDVLNEHGKCAVKFAQNHGISINEALEHPTVKAHAEVLGSLNEQILKEIYPKHNFLKNEG